MVAGVAVVMIGSSWSMAWLSQWICRWVRASSAVSRDRCAASSAAARLRIRSDHRPNLGQRKVELTQPPDEPSIVQLGGAYERYEVSGST